MPIIVFIIGLAFLISFVISDSFNSVFSVLTSGLKPSGLIDIIQNYFFITFAITFIIEIAICLYVSYLFVHKTNLANRLPKEIPGTYATITGLVFYLLFTPFLWLIPFINKTDFDFDIISALSHFSSFCIIIPAKILILFGVIRTLLAAQPSPRKNKYPHKPQQH